MDRQSQVARHKAVTYFWNYPKHPHTDCYTGCIGSDTYDTPLGL